MPKPAPPPTCTPPGETPPNVSTTTPNVIFHHLFEKNLNTINIRLPTLGKVSLWATNDLAIIEQNIPYQI